MLGPVPDGFVSPRWLWLLAGVAALGLLYMLVQTRKRPYAVRLPGLALLTELTPRRPQWRKHVPVALLLTSMVLLTVAVARPEGSVEVPRERATIIVALDTSLSMDAQDVAPTRDAAARRAATRFIEGLPERFNVGLVSFSGGAALVQTPTQDHGRVAAAVQDLTLGSGTAIGEAVYSSLSAIATLPVSGGLAAPPARIVLLSDGTNTVGRDVAGAVAVARDAGVPVSTIAFGTQQGVVAVEGRLISVPVDRPALADLATGTDGTSYVAESGQSLEQVYDDIGSQVGTVTERTEVTPPWLGAALGVAAFAALLSLAWGVRFP